MEAVRYFVALIILVTLPAALSMWIVIHPLARFWRRRGPILTYLVVGTVAVGIAATLFRLRHSLLRVEFGFSWALSGLGIICCAGAIWIERRYRRHITVATLLGLPEVSGRHPSRLLTEGIYGRIRHPRYVGILLEVSAFALFANYLTPYLVVVATLPLLGVIVVLEERELLERFGEDYECYRSRVPRFLPRRTLPRH